MNFKLEKILFEKAYLPIREYINIDEKAGTVEYLEPDEIPFPVTDGHLLDTVIRYYLTHTGAKDTRYVAQALGVDTRELSGAIHVLTGMTHADFLHKYRLRSIQEFLSTTTLPVSTIAKIFGYKTIRGLNRFLSDQTQLTANEIRAGKDAKAKQKRLAWWQIPLQEAENFE